MTRTSIMRMLFVLHALGCFPVTYTQLAGGPGSGDMIWTTSGGVLQRQRSRLGSVRLSPAPLRGSTAQ